MTKNRIIRNQKEAIIKLLIIAFTIVLNSVVGFSQSFQHVGNLERTIGSGNIDVGDYSAPIFADLDGDSDLDLYVGNYDGRIKVFTNVGSGIFSYAGYLKSAGVDIKNGAYASFAFADLDKDNDIDVYLGGYLGTIAVYLNDGSGNLTYTGFLQANGSNIDVGDQSAPTFADLDGDNDLDLYIGEFNGNIFIFKNNGSGNFISGGSFQANSAAIDVGSFSIPVFADLDGDSDLDLYVGNSAGSVSVFKNDGSGNFTASGYLQAGGSNIDVGDDSKLSFADIDGDNDLDAYIGELDGSVNVYRNSGTGTFTSAGYLQANNMTSEIDAGDKSVPAFADLDGDNDLDLYVGERLGGIQFYRNDGSGNFTYVGFLQAGGSNIDVGDCPTPVFADVDKDNDLDLYIGNQSGNIRAYTNNGSGVFSFSGLMMAGGSTISAGDFCSPAFADIDEDGDLDLYVAIEAGTIKKYVNNGSGTFLAAVSVAASGSSLTFADLDGDDDIDMYTGGGSIRIYKNDGSGNLTYTSNMSLSGADIGYIGEPEFADIYGNCIPSLFLGHQYGRLPYFKGTDATDPVISSTHTNQTLGDGVTCIVTLPDYKVNIIATDNCDNDLTITQNPAAGTTIAGQTNTVTLTVTDDKGNAADVSFNVAVTDNTDPVISSTHSNQNLDADASCVASLPDYTVNVTATDNCDDDLSIIQSPAAGTTISGETNTVTLTVTDDAGHTDQISFNVAVKDNTNPEITSTHNEQTLDADANCEASLPDYKGDVTATDNCDSELAITQSPAAGTIISGETNTITLTVTDDAGNSAEVNFNVKVEDNTSPEISSNHNDQTIDADANCEASLPDYKGYVTATDNCDAELAITQNPAAGTIISGTNNTVTLIVTDDAGNTDERTFNIAVEDKIKPVISSTHINQLINANAHCEATLPDYSGNVTASDNCDGSLYISQSPEAGTTISGETNTVTLTATDDAGNYEEVTFNVKVIDNTKPVITSTHNDQLLNSYYNCEIVLPDYTGNVVATDNCDSELTITQNPTAGTIISGSVNTVTLTATDNEGNSAEVSFNIGIIDNTSPVILSAHGNKTVDADDDCETTLPDYTTDVIATDNCDSELTITQNPTAGTIISGAINKVVITVTDDKGYTDAVIFNVEVIDITNPVITSTQANQIIDADNNCEATLPDYTAFVSATDNCDISLDVTQSPVPGKSISGAVNTVTLTVTDDYGNTDKLAFNVEVVDKTKPVISSTHSNQTIDALNNCEAILPNYTAYVTANDNCDANLYITQSPAAGTTISGATNTVTITVTDNNSNYSQVSFNVEVSDNAHPVILSTHYNQTVNTNNNCETTLLDYTDNVTAIDNCDPDLTVTQYPTAGTTISGATNTVTLTVTDDKGNFAKVSFNVAVKDNTKPTITCVGNQTMSLNGGQTAYTVLGTEFDPIAAGDNCGVSSIENDFNNKETLAGEQIPEGTTTIVWTITDNSGNENTCSFDITVSTYVGIDKLQEKGISIYPNPTNGIINFEFTDNNIQKITIYNITGKAVFEKVGVKQNEVVDLSDFANGLFVVILYTDKGIMSSKFIKE